MNQKIENKIQLFFLYIANPFYFLYLIILSILYEIIAFPVLLFCIGMRRWKLDDIMRIHNWIYGNLLIKASWPYLRVTVTGKENIPAERPFVFIINHRTFADIFFTSVIPIANQMITARSWVYRLIMFGWAMRLGRYIEIEKQTADSFRKICREYAQRKISFQFYPEGHRSRDGKLQRFRTGPFLIAVDNNLPVIPVCMEGIEKYVLSYYPYFSPAKVKIHFFPPVYPDSFPAPQQASKMRKYVKQVFKDHLQE